MAKNTSVILENRIDEFGTRQVAAGRYGSASEVTRAVFLRKLEDEEKKLETLRVLVEEGKSSGTASYS